MTDPDSPLNLDEPRAPHVGPPLAAAAAADAPRASGVGSLAIEEPHLTDYLRMLYKRRWLAGTMFVLILAGTVVYNFTAVPIYAAKTTILIDVQDPSIVDFKSVVNEDQTQADYYQTQYSLLQSRALARKTLDALHLWDNASFNPPPQPQGWNVRLRLASVTGAIASWFRSTPVQVPDPDETEIQSRTINAFLSHLDVSPVRNSRLVDVSYDLPDAALATRIANSLANNYIDQNLDYRFTATKQASDWLQQQLAEQQQDLSEKEDKLQQYVAQNDAISMEDKQNIVVQKLTDLNAAVTQAKLQRLQQEALYNQLEASQKAPKMLDTFPAILNDPFVQQLESQLAQLQQQYAQMSDKLGPNHPTMVALKSEMSLAQAKLDGEVDRVVQSVKDQYEAALAQEQSLTNALDDQKQAALAMNQKSIEYGVLQRDVDSSKQIYDSLMQRAKETGVSGELRTSNIRVVDPAERPLGPVSPRKSLNLLLALFGGGVFSMGLAFFFEYLDNRVKAPEEIKAHLGLPFLGLLPVIKSGDQHHGYPLLSDEVPPQFSEAFRGIRTNLIFSSAEEGARSVVVTSTAPREGKSLVTANLAIALAQAGNRVLLIDADLRKPAMHEVFDVSQEPGLSNFLAGTAKASESVRQTTVTGLWIQPAGRTPPNPAELLGSARFRSFLETAAGHFDWIVVDSPPVMAVTDASIVAHAVQGVLFVVGAEMTNRHAARRALEQLEAAQARFYGAVLNRVDLNRNAYYYSQYYRREYSTYYTQQARQP